VSSCRGRRRRAVGGSIAARSTTSSSQLSRRGQERWNNHSFTERRRLWRQH
jgi:hypothetical protein